MQDRRTIEEEQDEYEDLVLINMKDSYDKLSEKVKLPNNGRSIHTN